MASTRQLAAIMFTDIEGYTAIMQQDEGKAIILRNRHRQILQEEHKKFDGHIVQYYGDGTLSIFKSAVHAVQCGLAMQQGFQQLPKVPVRIGLHMGDVMVNDEQVIGDGVNLAARVESLGVAGAILMSDKVKDEITNHPYLKTISVGSYQFKNVTRKVEIFALAHEALIIPKHNSLKGKTQEKPKTKERMPEDFRIKSIAVLPFVNMSTDPDQEYFSDGMAEEIINSLSHLEELKVAGRISSFQFKDSKSSLTEIGEKLGVTSILQGSVRRQGNKVRIAAQLINVSDGFNLWSEKYDRIIDDIFSIQDDIALAVTDKLKVTLLTKAGQARKIYKPRLEAYELYLKGRFYMSRRGAGISRGLTYFKEAISIDPDFALAHAGYADANTLIATYGLMPPMQVMKKAKEAAERAIQLDPFLAEPYCALGYYYNYLEWNWEKARKNFLRSIELNPNLAEAHYRYGQNYLLCVGEFDEALKHAEMAIKIEPLSSICYGCCAIVLYTAGKFREALDTCRFGIELDANSFTCLLTEGFALIAIKQYDDAKKSFETAISISNRHPFPLNGLIWTYCLKGNMEQATVLMNELKERSASQYIAHTFTGISAAYLNHFDEAFEYLEKAYQERDPISLLLKYANWVPKLFRDDPRFSRLIDRIGLPEN